MKTLCIRVSMMFYLGAVIAIIAITSPAQASFMIDSAPGGEHYFISKLGNPVTSVAGNVGGNNTTLPEVNVTANADVATGSGYANITESIPGKLTSLTFTPADATKYGDFSFRGQLDPTSSKYGTFFNGLVTIEVTSHTGASYDYLFTIDKPNKDFKRIGVVSNDGDWLQSVKISTPQGGSFFEVKQVDFTYQQSPVPIPAAAWLLGTGLFGLVGVRRRMS